MEFSVLETSDGAGDTVRAVLRNGGDALVNYDLRFTDLERRSGSCWRPSDAGFGMPRDAWCRAISYGLAPGRADTRRRVVPRAYAEGTCRLSTGITFEGPGGHTARAQALTIVRGRR